MDAITALPEWGKSLFQINHFPGHAAIGEVARWVAWVKGKPDDFYERTRKSQRSG